METSFSAAAATAVSATRRVRGTVALGALLAAQVGGAALAGQGTVAHAATVPAVRSTWTMWPSFAAPSRWGTVTPDGAAPGDYDGDGRTDLAALTSTGAWVIAHASQGLRAPDTVLPGPYSDGTGRPAAADWDGDGRTDIAVLDAQGSLHIAESRSNATAFTRTVTGFAGAAGVRALAPADYDGDGRADLAYLDSAGNLVVAYSRENLATLHVIPLAGIQSPQLATADYNGDGIADAGILDASGTWRVMHGSATGLSGVWDETYSNAYGSSTTTHAVPADYVHNTAQPGAALAAVDAQGVWHGVERSGGGYAAWDSSVAGFRLDGAHFSTGDVDGDGRADLLVLCPSGRWLVAASSAQPAPSVFTLKSSFADTKGSGDFSAADVALGNFSGDGRSDLGARTSTGAFAVDAAANGLSAPDSVASGPYGDPRSSRLATGDYDGDGVSDVAEVDAQGVLRIAESSLHATTFTRAIPGFAAAAHIRQVAVGDYDGDGRADLAYLDDAQQLVVAYSRESWARLHVVDLSRLSTPVVAAADFNGDGVSDIGVLDATGTWRIRYGSAPPGGHGGGGLGARWDQTLANGYGSSTEVQPVPADYLHDPANPGAALAVVDAQGVLRVAPRSGGTYGAYTQSTAGFDPTARFLTGDVDGDGRADLVQVSRSASPAAFAGDPAAVPQLRWWVHGSAPRATPLMGYDDAEGSYGAILDDSPRDPAIPGYNTVWMEWGSTAPDGVHSYTGAYLVNRIDMASARGATVVLDLTFLFLQRPDQLPVLREALCPRADVCRHVWFSAIDEPYGHGETPQVFGQQVDLLRQTFPEPAFRILMVEGSDAAVAPTQGCPNPSTVSFWCWWAVDPQDVIPAAVDAVALDSYTFSAYSISYRSLRAITTKPLLGWIPSWWTCNPNCASFPQDGSLPGEDSAPADDTFRFLDDLRDDPQVIGYTVFLWGHPTPTTSPSVNTPYGVNALVEPLRQTYLRIQRSMMVAMAVAPLPESTGDGPHPASYSGLIASNNPSTSAVLERFVANGCVPDPTLQGSDGWVVDMGGAGAFTVTATSPAPFGYDAFVYDGACNQLAYQIAPPGGTLTMSTAVPARWVVLHLGLGAAMSFTLTPRYS